MCPLVSVVSSLNSHCGKPVGWCEQRSSSWIAAVSVIRFPVRLRACTTPTREADLCSLRTCYWSRGGEGGGG